MTGQGSLWFGSTEFYSETINQSLRFNKPDTPHLERTFVTPSSTRKVIIATWIKPSELTSTTPIMYSAPTSATTSYFLMSFAAASYIHSKDSFKIFTVEGNSGKIMLQTDAKFRDTTNWLHVCVAIDSEQATSTDRVMIFFNGKRYTGGYDTYNTFPSQNHDFTVMNSAIKHRVGSVSNGLHNNYGNLQGYLSEFYFVDGQSMFSDTSGTINSTFLADANTLATFCEQKNGVAVPKAYSGTFGNNGCRLTFEATGTGTTAESTDNSDSMTNIGDDKSGQGHNFSVNGLTSTDVVLDSPTNNFCTMNPLDGNGPTINEGSLKVYGDTSFAVFEGFKGTFGVSSGKWYWEMHAKDVNNLMQVGITPTTATAVGSSTNLSYHTDAMVYQNTGAKRIGTGGLTTSPSSATSSSYGNSYTDDDVIGIALDLDSSPTTLTFYKNGVSEGTAFSSLASDEYVPLFTGIENSFGIFNFGQDATFAGTKTSGSDDASDANGRGIFFETPPSGHLALCSANLPNVEIGPNSSTQADDHFDTDIYDGSASNQTRTLNFQADWMWFKERTTDGINHELFDSSRLHSTSSAKFGEKLVIGGLTSVAADSTSIVSQSTNDITLLGGVSTVNDQYSRKYVNWHWKANGGTTSSNTNGSITSTVQANTTAGFSIVLYTGDGGTSATIGHGLKSAPEWVLIFGRNVSNSQMLGVTPIGFTKYASFQTTGGYFVDDDTIWNDTAPTSTVFTVGSAENVNDAYNYVAYCFHSVEGYSKIGTYAGNGDTSSDGPYVHLGFRPSWLFVKRTNDTGGAIIWDNKRSTFNPTDDYLVPQLTDNEEENSSTQRVDFLSNGFKVRNGATSNSINGSGSTYLFLAFAEQPFKFSNAR